jgi:hypothetical protein
VEQLGLTPLERARVRNACTWMEVTASFLPYLRRYLVARLADTPELAAKIAGLDDRDTYYLWEWIKDEQLRPVLSGPEANETPAAKANGEPRPLV